MSEKMKNGTLVNVNLDNGIEFEGRVVGHGNELPHLGVLYMVSKTSADGIVSEEYPYNVCNVPALYLTVIEVK